MRRHEPYLRASKAHHEWESIIPPGEFPTRKAADLWSVTPREARRRLEMLEASGVVEVATVEAGGAVVWRRVA
jgi:hypothetical protein